MSNKIKWCFLKVQRASPGALRRGTARGIAAPQPSSPGQIQPVRSSRHLYRLDAKHAEPHKPSIIIPIIPTLFQVFVKLPCPCQARGPGNSHEYSYKYLYEYVDKYLNKYSYKYCHEYV